MPATTSGVDLKGKTSSAVAKPLALGGVVEVFSAISELFSSVVNPFSDSLADSEESLQPKCPCKISRRDDVSVPAKAIFI